MKEPDKKPEPNEFFTRENIKTILLYVIAGSGFLTAMAFGQQNMSGIVAFSLITIFALFVYVLIY